MLPAQQRIPKFASGGQPQGQQTQATVLPAPTQGIQANKSLMAMEPTEAIYSYNLLPKEYGMEVRPGYREFADISDNTEVRSVMEFHDGLDSKLFAATTTGIYDITAGGTINAAAPVYTWPFTGGDAGFCIHVNFSNSAGQHLLVCDEQNGYVRYSTSGGWVVGGVTGPTGGDTKLVHVCEFKEKLWFVEKETGMGWYLATSAITGAATSFVFGKKFAKGGYLRGLFNWTIDGGDGIDDYLIAVGDEGDILAYKGVDPAQPGDFQKVGNWYVGQYQIIAELAPISVESLSSCAQVVWCLSPSSFVEGSLGTTPFITPII